MTHFGTPTPASSIAIFAGASARERGFGAPSLQARSNFGASYSQEADAVTDRIFNEIPGASAASGEWDWNALGKTVQNIASGVNAFLQNQQQPPGIQQGFVNPNGSMGQVYQGVTNLPPPPPAAPATPQWLYVAGAVAVALALYAVLGTKSRRR